MHYIEAGWPGGKNPKDDELYRASTDQLKLETSTPTRRGTTPAESDDTERPRIGPSAGSGSRDRWAWHHHLAHPPRAPLAEGVAMVGDSVEFLRRSGMDVLFDAEHFFDGFKRNPEFSSASSKPQ